MAKKTTKQDAHTAEITRRAALVLAKSPSLKGTPDAQIASLYDPTIHDPAPVLENTGDDPTANLPTVD